MIVKQTKAKNKTTIINDVNVRTIEPNNPIRKQGIINKLIDTGEISIWDKDYDPNERLR
jgi:hypothetical protein